MQMANSRSLGCLCVFHNDHCINGTVKKRVRYMEKAGSQATGPKNERYWEDLDEAVDLMAVVCKKPNALIGGDHSKYGLLTAEDTERYIKLTEEVRAVVGARGIVSDDCVNFLHTVEVPDQLHVHADSAESWSAYVLAKTLRAPYARQLQKELIAVCESKKMIFEDRGDNRVVVEDLRKMLLHGRVRLEDVEAIAEDEIQAEQRAHSLKAQELEDSGDEDMAPRRLATAAQLAAAPAVVPSGTTSEEVSERVVVCLLCHNMYTDDCPRCEASGVETSWADLPEALSSSAAAAVHTEPGDPRLVHLQVTRAHSGGSAMKSITKGNGKPPTMGMAALTYGWTQPDQKKCWRSSVIPSR